MYLSARCEQNRVFQILYLKFKESGLRSNRRPCSGCGVRHSFGCGWIRRWPRGWLRRGTESVVRRRSSEGLGRPRAEAVDSVTRKFAWSRRNRYCAVRTGQNCDIRRWPATGGDGKRIWPSCSGGSIRTTGKEPHPLTGTAASAHGSPITGRPVADTWSHRSGRSNEDDGWPSRENSESRNIGRRNGGA